MTTHRITVDTRSVGQVRVITLDDAERLNPLSAGTLGQLRDALRCVRHDPQVRAVVLTGSGRAFCAGGDVDGFGAASPLAVQRGMAESQQIVREIVGLPLPVLAAVNGVAAGAGFSLAVACDIVVAAQNARFVSAFDRIGAVPDLGLARLLQRSVGMHRALNLLLTGEALSAAQARDIGLVSRVVPSGDLLDTALAIASALASGPTLALGLAKKLVREAANESWDGFLDAEANAQALAFSSQDFAEGVAAFLAKRPPAFRGL